MSCVFRDDSHREHLEHDVALEGIMRISEHPLTLTSLLLEHHRLDKSQDFEVDTRLTGEIVPIMDHASMSEGGGESNESGADHDAMGQFH